MMIGSCNSDNIKSLMRNHSKEITLVNLAMTSAVAGLMYSEYLRNFKKTIRPTMKVQVPETETVRRLLEMGSGFANALSDTIVDRMLGNHLLSERLYVPELFLFRTEHCDALKIIFETYIVPNIARYVPSILRQKFGLDDPSVQTFVESNELDMFDRSFPADYHHQFIADEAVLQLLLMLGDSYSELTECPSNMAVDLPIADEEVLSVGNQNAITVMHFNDQIIRNDKLMELLSFVTDSQFNEKPDGYVVRSNVYNQLIRCTILPSTSAADR